MGKSKIQNEREVLRWFEEGRTCEWMVRTYRQKYNIETTISMWANFRRRRGLVRRLTWDDELILWKIKPQHNHGYPILMLRKEARRGWVPPAGRRGRRGGRLAPRDAT